MIYPVTIIMDRYGGVYSSAEWTAWNLYENQIPDGPGDSDIECAVFWASNTITVGKGNTPQAAYNDLKYKLAHPTVLSVDK